MKKSLVLLAVLALGAACQGCLFSDVRAPLAYGSATPGDFGAGPNLGKEVSGSACNTAILWLVAWGDGGFEAAVKDARAKASASYLADVKADTQYTNVVFGIYQHQCTTISARVASAPGAAP